MFDAHLANPEYTAEELRRAMTSPHLRPVRIAPMGVDLPPPIDPDRRLRLRYAVRSRLQVQASARIVLYAGRLSPEKNVDALVDVAARLASRNRYLVIAGDGPQRDSMTRACAVAAPGVTRFVNHVNRDGMWELLAAADVFVHPNPREPFGIGPLEAMAGGVPVVLPRAGGLLTYATDENAWLVDPSASSLAGGVDVVLDTPRHALERKLSAARVTAAGYAWPASAARMLREYDRFHDARMAGRRFEAQTTIATRNPRPATRSSA
jgi:glycosyltransferase involved in cell wall biosynthesis